MYGYLGQNTGTYPGQQQLGGYPRQHPGPQGGGYPQQQLQQQHQQQLQQQHQQQLQQQLQQQHQQQPPYGYPYQPPPGPPPQQQPPQGYGYPQYPPPGPYHDQQQQQRSLYAPPQGPPPIQWQPPPYPPPSGLDVYGYPQSLGSQYRQPSRGDGSGPFLHGEDAHRPPTGSQQFGHGAPSDYTFKYSNCTGRRKALLIGINYFGQTGELKGCINDVLNVSAFLTERHGYRREDMVVLTDDQSDPVRIPTKENIIRAMQWLVSGAQPDDALFLHYSGHGGQTADKEGDEIDGYNEVIYPVDYKKAGHIEDDVIHNTTVRSLQAGVRLTAIFDSCHSATVMDLPYIYSTKGALKEPNLAAETGKGLLSAAMSYARGDIGAVASGLFGIAQSAFRGDGAHNKTIETRTSPADVIMFSGCKDAQTSADATIDAKATGALSWALIKTLRAKPQQTYVELLNNIREILRTKYSQKPQLSCSHPLDTNLLFVM